MRVVLHLRQKPLNFCNILIRYLLVNVFTPFADFVQVTHVGLLQ
jgi:hypothetical protein